MIGFAVAGGVLVCFVLICTIGYLVRRRQQTSTLGEHDATRFFDRDERMR